MTKKNKEKKLAEELTETLDAFSEEEDLREPKPKELDDWRIISARTLAKALGRYPENIQRLCKKEGIKKAEGFGPNGMYTLNYAAARRIVGRLGKGKRNDVRKERASHQEMLPILKKIKAIEALEENPLQKHARALFKRLDDLEKASTREPDIVDIVGGGPNQPEEDRNDSK